MAKSENILRDFNPYELDFINKLISVTQKDKEYFFGEAQEMFEYIYLFHQKFPHEINFENEIILKEEFIVDRLQKVYTQIKSTEPTILETTDTIKIFYYLYDPRSSAYWSSKNINIGEEDENNILNTGTSLIYKYFYINWKDFMDAYEVFLN